MGTTKIKATIDRNIIACDYIRFLDIGDSNDTIDITVKLLYEFITAANVIKEITLEEFIIPSGYLVTAGLAGATSEVTQAASFNILNPRYQENLYIEISESRDGSPVTTKVPVLDGEDSTIPEMPDNPYKDPENEENIPEVEPDEPYDNVSDPEIEYQSYSLEEDDLTLMQSSKRFYLEPMGDGTDTAPNTFAAQAFNEKIDRIFIENSIANLAPNAGLLDEPGNKYVLDAPGFVVADALADGDIAGTKILKIRASNNNVFNAFNSLTFRSDEPGDLYPGTQALTVSSYYTIQSTFNETPFDDFKIRVRFYDGVGNLISTEEDVFPVGPEGKTWQVLYASFQGSQIPPAAVRFDFDIEVAGVDSSDYFELHLYLPQVESVPYYTTRTIDQRVLDKYRTTREIAVKPPIYFTLTSHHVSGPGVRGLMDSTDSQKDGIQFLSSSNQLRLKAWDAAGSLTHNIGSSTFSVVEGERTEYGVFITDTEVKFYLNGTLLSTHATAIAIDQTKYPLVGSLWNSNTTINSEILDFKILRSGP